MNRASDKIVYTQGEQILKITLFFEMKEMYLNMPVCLCGWKQFFKGVGMVGWCFILVDEGRIKKYMYLQCSDSIVSIIL